MTFGKVHHLPYIRNYEEALTAWERAPQPAAKRRGSSIWDTHQRPLDRGPGGNRKWHYRIEKDGEAFDICLYHTVMARHEKPEGSVRIVHYAGDSSMTSKSFMWRVLGTGFLRKETTTDGIEVAVPIAADRRLSTRLTFIDGRLDVSRSTHPQMYTYVMSDEDKKLRKEMREKLQFWVHAMELRMPMFEKEVTAPLGWSKSPIIRVLGSLWGEALGGDSWADRLSDYAQTVYDSLVVRASRKGASAFNPTPEVFRRSLMNNVLKELGANEKNKRVELPKFMEWSKYPKGAAR